MLWKSYILSLLPCFIITKCEVFAGNFGRFEFDIIKHVQVKAKSNNSSVVKFKNISCVVHYYNLILEPKPDEMRSKSMQFYFCLNCVFADWIQNELFKLIEGVPYLRYVELGSSINDEFRNKVSVETIANISVIIERFLNVLFAIVNMYTYPAHIDTGLMKSLLLLYFKLNVITNLYSNNNNVRAESVGTSSTTSGHDGVIIPLILDSINAFQRYYALNCDVSSWYYDESTIFGYSTKAPNSNERINIDQFFLDIYSKDTVPHDRCTIGRILLRDILQSEEDIVAREISKVKLKLVHGYVHIKDILAEFGNSYNLEFVLWYQRIVHRAIVKIVCTKMLDTLGSKHDFSFGTIVAFKVLNFLFSDFTDLPQRLVDIFSLLASDNVLNTDNYTAIKKTVGNYLGGRYVHDETVYFASRLPFFHIEVIAEKSISSLEHFLNTIMNKIADYRCMVNVLKFLNVDKAKYYLPHVQRSFTVDDILGKMFRRNTLAARPRLPGHDKQTIDPEVPDTCSWHDENKQRGRETQLKIIDNRDLQDKTCNYLIMVYKICVDSVVDQSRHESLEDRSAYLSELKNTVYTITHYLEINLFKTNHRSASLSQVAFSLAAMGKIVGSQLAQDDARLLYSEGLPYLYAVMTTLNEYGLMHCGPPKYNFLMFNNFDAIDKRIYVDERKSFLEHLGRPKYVAKDGVRLSTIYGLYEVYKDEADLKYLLFYWRGETRTFKNIFNNLRNTVMDPVYVYELHDVYFKYVLAKIYYETFVYVDRLCAIEMNVVNAEQTLFLERFGFYQVFYTTCMLPPDNFPRPFRYFIGLLNLYLSKFFKYASNHSVFLPHTQDKIKVEKEFAKLGVVVNKPLTTDNKQSFNMDEESLKASEFKSKIESIVASINNTFIERFVEKYI